MRYYVLEPEVAGGFGANSVMDPTTRPPRIEKFHYEMDGWLGDELLESVATFLTTERVERLLKSAELTGVEFGVVEVTTSTTFRELYPSRQLPMFRWLQISGIAGVDDFGMSANHRLVVSERALTTLQGGALNHCRISEYSVT